MMKLMRTLRSAVNVLRRNVMRSLLTTLGIVIGVSAVIAITEIGNGSSQAIQKSIASMGANVLIIFPGQAQVGGVSSGGGSAMSITPQDVEAIQRECPAIKYVAPVVSSRVQIVAGDKNWVPQNITGTTPQWLKIRAWDNFSSGEAFTDSDVRSGARYCIIGQTIATQLFEGQNPLGKELRLRNVAFKIVGVLARKGGNMMGQDQDDIVVAPWTSIKYRVSNSQLGRTNQSSASAAASDAPNSLNALYPGQSQGLYASQSASQAANNPMPVRFTNVDQIMASAASADQIDTGIRQITALLRERHHLRAGEPDDFQIRSLTEFTDMLTNTSRLMSTLLLCVAAISLVVGGVGIMNIMLVSVTERTREIGLRMAVGARSRDILRQFLVESVMLCLMGGAVGIAVGRGSSIIVSTILKWPTAASVGAIVAAVAVSASVGIVFGYYPAWKASRLDPIEALRYE